MAMRCRCLASALELRETHVNRRGAPLTLTQAQLNPLLIVSGQWGV